MTRFFVSFSTMLLLGLSLFAVSPVGAAGLAGDSIAARAADAPTCQCKDIFTNDVDRDTTGSCCARVQGTPVNYGCMTDQTGDFIECCGASNEQGGCF
ncbi:hypothetical protein HETIRDRAFT_449148 [Heterobasidion irregulare TC 32-1]|uniref:Uncharacterized protein n=1 Tax=Heterobasidion irregulare (strain TC 32-1) TaxID=747525 RepID=W4KKF0_HETIT|nr:uncharacterized protein HETIRDRAFT_449148 [Heterobasidion irregulare TC 32-1]ETW86287.1 hypothetical protein HETIRDRAFT_449148 [Heterobasidion irregulare TC 32-1]